MSSLSLSSISSAPAPVAVIPTGNRCHFDVLPYELMCYIFSDPEFNNPLLEIISAIGLSKMEANKDEGLPKWQVAADQQIRRNIYEKYAFGSEKWKRFFGADVEESSVDSLPKNIGWILAQPFENREGILSRIFRAIVGGSKNSEKSVGEMCMLIWMPKGLTINSIEKFVQSYFSETGSCYTFIGAEFVAKYGDTPIKESYWMLLTKDVLDGSRDLSFAAKTKLVAEFADSTHLPYEVPRALEVITCVFAKYLSSGTVIFGRNPSTYSICLEEDRIGRSSVGYFAPAGLVVLKYDFSSVHLGVAAALRKF